MSNEDTYQSNRGRAKRAARILDLYGDPGEPNLRDLLTDLMHYANKTHIDFPHELEVAEMHFEAETEGEQGSKNRSTTDPKPWDWT